MSESCKQFVIAFRHPLLAESLLEVFSEGGDDLEEITRHTIAREFEDRGFGIFVDCDDDFRGAHAGLMLNRAADTAGDVQIGRNGLARLTHLMRIWNPAGIDRSSTCADCCAKCLS